MESQKRDFTQSLNAVQTQSLWDIYSEQKVQSIIKSAKTHNDKKNCKTKAICQKELSRVTAALTKRDKQN